MAFRDLGKKWIYILGYSIGVSKEQVLKPWLSLFSGSLNSKEMIFRFSTSIQNFADRVRNQNDVYEWSWQSLFKPTVFLGLYHEGDWLRILIHRGPRLAFWCGGDVLRLQQKPLWQWLLKCVKIDHVCENIVEQKALKKMGFYARIHPILFFDDINKYKVTFKPSKKPHVWITSHKGREDEYGVRLIQEMSWRVPEITFHIFGEVEEESWDYSKNYNQWLTRKSKNIIYHGQVPSEELDKMIQNYQAGLRTCEFDGCPHTVTKGILHGQYPINKIPYPFTESYQTKEELIQVLKNLKNRTKPNLAGREYWLPILTKFPWA